MERKDYRRLRWEKKQKAKKKSKNKKHVRIKKVDKTRKDW